jgi:hypothetical protein
MTGFRVTYDIVTEYSAAEGECAESGFIISGGYHVDIDTALADDAGDYSMRLREALDYCYPQENCGSWFTEVDERLDYRTGDSETRSLHPPRNITASSYKRLCRLFKVKE